MGATGSSVLAHLPGEYCGDNDYKSQDGILQTKLRKHITSVELACALTDAAEERGFVVEPSLRSSSSIIQKTAQQANHLLDDPQVPFCCDMRYKKLEQCTEDLCRWEEVWRTELQALERAVALVNKAEGFRMTGQFQQALEPLEEALEMRARDPCLLAYRGRIRIYLNLPDEAYGDFVDAREKCPRLSVPGTIIQQLLPLAEGQVHYKMERKSEALQCLKRALGVVPLEESELRDRALDLVCSLKLETGGLPEISATSTFRSCVLALNDNLPSHVERLLRENPDDVDALMIRGKKRLESNTPEQAVEDFDHVLQINGDENPDNVDVYLQRSLANQHLHEFTAALADCFAAQELDDENQQVRDRIGVLRDLLAGDTFSLVSHKTADSALSNRSSQPLLKSPEKSARSAGKLPQALQAINQRINPRWLPATNELDDGFDGI